MRRKLITKGFFGCSLRFTTGKNSGKIDKNNFVPQNDPGARCLWALTETGLENSPILEGNKPYLFSFPILNKTLENSPILEGNKPVNCLLKVGNRLLENSPILEGNKHRRDLPFPRTSR